MQPVEKCKLEIRIRLYKLEKYAIAKDLPLSTDTILTFMEFLENQETPQNTSSSEPVLPCQNP